MPPYYKVQMCAESIAQQCKKPRKTATGYMVCCPAHTDKHPSLSIFIGTSRVVLTCFANCREDTIADCLSLTPDERALIAHSRSLPTLSPRARAPKAPKEIPDAPARQASLKKRWDESRPITSSDPVGRYLIRRGLWQEPLPKSLRYHPSLVYKHDDETRTYHPALIAIIQTPDNTPVGMHRIYLDMGGHKAEVSHPKKLYIARPWEGAAVRLGRAGKALIVSEGIETGLATRKSTGVPTWAAISEGGMRRVIVPDGVELVIIAADNDVSGIGLQAARALADRLMHEGRDVKICLPSTPGSDWADGLEEVHGG